MTARPLTIGIHSSGLARSQAEHVASLLQDEGIDFSVHLEIISGLGDTASPLHDDHVAENRGEIRQLHSLLRNKSIDVVIHSGFDIRGDIPDDLRIGAILPRGNPYDVLLAPREVMLDEFDDEAVVGVVQLRARSQLLSYRDDIRWELISGDAADWLTSMIDGRIDALIGPGAAMETLGLTNQVCEIFPPEMLVPAPGSGVLMCLVRRDDELNRKRLSVLHNATAATEYTAECAMMESLGGPWEMPIGALAQFQSDRLLIHAVVASADGSKVLREHHMCLAKDPCQAGTEVAALLSEAGALELLGGVDLEEAACETGEIIGEIPAVAESSKKSKKWDATETFAEDHDFADFEDLLIDDEDSEDPSED